MPSPVISLQIFIVYCGRVFFPVCLGQSLWLGRREAAFLLISDTYTYINQQYLSGLSTSPKLQTAQGITVTTKTFSSVNKTTGMKSLHRWETVSTKQPSKMKGKFWCAGMGLEGEAGEESMSGKLRERLWNEVAKKGEHKERCR